MAYFRRLLSLVLIRILLYVPSQLLTFRAQQFVESVKQLLSMSVQLMREVITVINLPQVNPPTAYVCADSKIYDATEWYICQVKPLDYQDCVENSKFSIIIWICCTKLVFDFRKFLADCLFLLDSVHFLDSMKQKISQKARCFLCVFINMLPSTTFTGTTSFWSPSESQIFLPL